MTAFRTYMDYNATTRVKPVVAATVCRIMENVGNPSSVHGEGREAHRLLEEARSEVAALVAVRSSEIVFTSGGTESNSLAILGLVESNRVNRLLISSIEHPSVMAAAAASGCDVSHIPVNSNGVIDLAALEALLGEDAEGVLVSVMLANNETGVIQPISKAVSLAHKRGALFHSDAAQGVGRFSFDVPSLGVDLMTLSSHKMGGPMGVGALYVRDGLVLSPRVSGGGQESGRRGGTHNLPGIAGFGVAAATAVNDLANAASIADLRDTLEARLLQIAPNLIVFGQGAARLANTSCFSLPGLSSETQLMQLDLNGVAVSAGSACSSGKVGASHVLEAMNVDQSIAQCAIRVSMGWDSSSRDVEKFLNVWGELYFKHMDAVSSPITAVAG